MGVRRSQLLDAYEQLIDSLTRNRRKNLEGQFDLFSLGQEKPEPVELVLRDLPEFSQEELMTMEKEVTGLYLSGHPMDAYRDTVRAQGAVPIASVLEDFAQEEGPTQFQDGQRILLAGVVAAAKTKTTKNNSLMAYVTLEDDTGSMELLTFSNVLTQFGSLVQEGAAVVVIGRLSIRDEKDPQVVVNRVRSILDYADGNLPEEGPQPARSGKLYLRLASEAVPEYRKTRAILNMFPGTSSVLLYFADTQVRRGTMCGFQEDMLQELTALLGKENVVLK